MPEARPPESPAAAFRTDFACALDRVRPAVRRVIAFLAGEGCAPEDRTACERALVEACNNAVRHVPPERRDQPVYLEALCDPGVIELRVTDHTLGFDWPERVELPAPESEQGRGLYLIHASMQSARYFQGRGENILVLRRLRQTRGAGFSTGAAQPADLAACRLRLAESEEIISQMVEELSSCYESLSAIFRYGAEQVPPGQFKDFARRLLVDMKRILGADWFVMRALPEKDPRLTVLVASEPALELEPLFLPGQPAGSSSAEAIAAITGQDVWFDRNRPLADSDPLGRIKAGAGGLAHPLFLGGKLVGTLAVGLDQAPVPPPATSPRAVFSAGQTNVITTFGDFLAIQIVNARFQEQQLKNRVVARELEIAETIQRSLLPQTLPTLPGVTLAATCESARKVGGDFYDALPLDEDRLLLVIADVIGKGIPAALFAAMLRTLLRTVPEAAADPAGILARLNRVLFPDLSSVDMFITVQLALVQVAQRRLVVAGAGHCPLLLSGPNREPVKAVAPEGMPLGILPDTPYVNATLEFPRGARALLYTDGLTETLNEGGDRFGQERLMQWFHAHAGADADQLRNELLAELARFRNSAKLNDDLTLILLAG